MMMSTPKTTESTSVNLAVEDDELDVEDEEDVGGGITLLLARCVVWLS